MRSVYLSLFLPVLLILLSCNSESRDGPSIHDPSELHYENGYFMTFSTGIGIQLNNRIGGLIAII